MREFTVIYSSASIETAKDLINEFINVFEVRNLTADDMFYFGVFCDSTVYANFREWDSAPRTLVIPPILENICSTERERIEFVEDIIDKIMRGEMERPEWMMYVEENAVCDDYEQMPSTFLRLIAKHEDYEKLGEKLLAFLYSPNMFTSKMYCNS